MGFFGGMKNFSENDRPEDKAKDFDRIADDAKKRGEQKAKEEDERRWGKRS